MEAEVGVQGESQIERRGVFGQCDELAFGRKDKYLGTEQVELCLLYTSDAADEL